MGPVQAVGAEGLPEWWCQLLLETGYVVVIPRITVPTWKSPYNHGSPGGEQAPAPATELIDVLEPPRHSVQQPGSVPE